MTDKRILYTKKIIIIILGSILSAYGIALAVHAGFGGATLAVLWQGVSKTLHITLGQASLLIAVLMIVFVWFYDRKQIHIGTVLYQIIYSTFVDLFGGLLLYSNNRSVNFLLMLVGIILFAVGTGLYAATDMGRGSYEAVTFALSGRKGWQIKTVRRILDFSVVVLGILLGGSFGWCTICTILLSGPVIQHTARQACKLFTNKERKSYQ